MSGSGKMTTKDGFCCMVFMASRCVTLKYCENSSEIWPLMTLMWFDVILDGNIYWNYRLLHFCIFWYFCCPLFKFTFSIDVNSFSFHERNVFIVRCFRFNIVWAFKQVIFYRHQYWFNIKLLFVHLLPGMVICWTILLWYRTQNCCG